MGYSERSRLPILLATAIVLAMALVGCGSLDRGVEPIATLTATDSGVLIETDGFLHPIDEPLPVTFVNDQDIDVTISLWRFGEGEWPLATPPPDRVIYAATLAPGETLEAQVEFPEPGEYSASPDPSPDRIIGGNFIDIWDPPGR